MPAQFARYASVGAIGTAVQYVLLVALVQGLAIGAVVASTLGAIVGAAINYLLNHRFTFASTKPHAHALRRFAVVAAAGIVVNAAVVAAVLTWVSPHYLVAQIIATGVVLLLGYCANRMWTF